MRGKVYKRRVVGKLAVGSLPGNLLFNDFYNVPGSLSNRISEMIEHGALVYGNKGKLKVVIKAHTLTPWWTAPVSSNRDCPVLHETYFDMFGIIPRKCRECWKIVLSTDIDPAKQTVLDLFRLRDLLQSTGFPCKCGVDIRLITPSRYAGFIYADSLEQGRVYYKEVFGPMNRTFKNPKVILKRGCTEFEHQFGDSSKWDELTLQFDPVEDYLNFMLETHDVPSIIGYNLHQQSETFRFWIEYAHGIGDSTWKKALAYQGYESPETLFFNPVTYHEEKEDG